MGVFTSTKQFRLGLNLTNPWWLSGASIDLDLDNGRYYDSSLTSLKRSLATVTDYLSCTRASIGYAKTASGTLTQFGNNVLRITDLGLLVEDARTNTTTYSQQFDNVSGWSAAGLSVAANQTSAPDGTVTADSLTSSGTGNHLVGNLAFFSGAGTSLCTITCYAKQGVGAGWCILRLTDGTNLFGKYFDLVNGLVGSGTDINGTGVVDSASIESLAGGWFRLTATGHFSSSPSPLIIEYHLAGGDGNQTVTVGDQQYVWGAQSEIAAFASSYIPTTTASAVRAADLVTCAGNLASVITAVPQTVLADVILNQQVLTSGQSYLAFVGVSSGDGFNIIELNADDVAQPKATVRLSDGTPLKSNIFGNSLTYFTGVKVGVAQSSGGRSIVGGGAAVVSDANPGQVPATVVLGYSSVARGYVYGYYRRLTVWNSRIADATLQALTAP